MANSAAPSTFGYPAPSGLYGYNAWTAATGVERGPVAVLPQTSSATAHPFKKEHRVHPYTPGDSFHGGDFQNHSLSASALQHKPACRSLQDISGFLASFGQDLFFNPGSQRQLVCCVSEGPVQNDAAPRWAASAVELQIARQQQRTAPRMNNTSGHPAAGVMQAHGSALPGWPDARQTDPAALNSLDNSSVFLFHPSTETIPLTMETTGENMMATSLEFGGGSGSFMHPTMDLGMAGMAEGMAEAPVDLSGMGMMAYRYEPEDVKPDISFCNPQPSAACAAAVTAAMAAASAHTTMSRSAVSAAAAAAAAAADFAMHGNGTKCKVPYRVGTQSSSRGGSPPPRSPRRRQKHICRFCSKVLDTKYKLERHLRTHTGERPFECQKCHARFNQKSSLKTHSNIHAREALKDPATTSDTVESIQINGYRLGQLGIPYAKAVFDAIHQRTENGSASADPHTLP